jgi:hypothetical protein
MKNMMIALCMLTISYAANAQYDPAFRFGIKAGANLSNINSLMPLLPGNLVKRATFSRQHWGLLFSK